MGNPVKENYTKDLKTQCIDFLIMTNGLSHMQIKHKVTYKVYTYNVQCEVDGSNV